MYTGNQDFHVWMAIRTIKATVAAVDDLAAGGNDDAAGDRIGAVLQEVDDTYHAGGIFVLMCALATLAARAMGLKVGADGGMYAFEMVNAETNGVLNPDNIGDPGMTAAVRFITAVANADADTVQAMFSLDAASDTRQLIFELLYFTAELWAPQRDVLTVELARLEGTQDGG
jgi:hypothetical protein